MKRITALVFALAVGLLVHQPTSEAPVIEPLPRAEEAAVPISAQPAEKIFASLPEEVRQDLADVAFDYTFHGSAAWNASQQFSARYASAHGMRIKGEMWDLRMRLAGSGGGSKPVATDDTLNLNHGCGIEERWANSSAGIEHAVLLATADAPGRDEDGRARVAFAVQTPLVPSVSAGRKSVEFRDVAGEIAFQYSDLRVIDARGKTLPSEIELAKTGEGRWELALLADDVDASYPLTIDPLMATGEGSLHPDNLIAAGALGGYSVAISGDVLVAGVPRIGASGEEGIAAVYRYNAAIHRWDRETILAPTVPVSGEYFGIAVDIWGERVVVGADDRAVVFDYVSGTSSWEEVASIDPVPANDEDDPIVLGFGSSVAVEGDLIFVGAPGSTYLNHILAGAVQAFRKSEAGDWEMVRNITAYSPQPGAAFGSSLSSSGNRLAIGAPAATPSFGAPDAGTAFVIGYLPGSLAAISIREVDAPNDASGARFGHSVSLDGDTLVVGSPNFDWAGDSDSGVAEIFEFDNDNSEWDWESILIPPDGSEDDRFGTAVAVSGDTIVVGAPEADSGGFDPGAVYLFERYDAGASPGNNAWGFAEKRFGAGTNFGFSVAASGDRFVVGAPTSTVNSSDSAGSISTFTRRSTRWRTLEGLAGDGHAVAIDRGFFITGEPNRNRVRFARRNRLSSSATENWPTNTVDGIISPPDVQDGQGFGASVALHEPWLLVGAPGWDEPGAEDSGRCYLYLHTEGGAETWTHIATYGLPVPEAGAQFGERVDIGDRWFAASGPDGDGGDGLVRIYDRLLPSSGLTWGFTQEVHGGGGRFGAGLTLHPAGNLLAIGSPMPRDSAPDHSGSTTIYQLDTTSSSNPWRLLKRLNYETEPTATPNARSGTSLGFRGDLLVVGEPGWEGGGRLVAREWNRGQVGEENNWGIRWSIQVPGANPDAEFGAAVAVTDRFIIGGAPGWLEHTTATGAAFAFDPALASASAGDVAPQDMLLLPTAQDGDRAGAAVAADGIEVAVGLQRATLPASNTVGRMAVFTRQWWAWAPRPLGSFGDAGFQNGHAVDIEGDYLAFSIPFDTVDGKAGAGSVRILKRVRSDFGGWTGIRTLVSPNPTIGGNFGKSLGFSGNALVVGAPGDDGGEGAGYLFERNFGSPDAWGASREFAPPELSVGDDFGVSAGIDGDVIAFGASGREGAAPGSANAGSIFIYGNQLGATKQWVFNQEIQSPLASANEFFGASLAVQGHRVLVGATGTDINVSNSGSAHLYGRLGEAAWGLVRTLLAPRQETGSLFGFSVALDGSVAVVGAPRDNYVPGIASGSAHIFLRDRGGSGSWGYDRTLLPGFGEADPPAGRDFGWSVAVRGRRIAVSAPRTTVGAVFNAGAVHVFDESAFGNGYWGESFVVTAEGANPGDQAGGALALGPDTILVGVPLHDRMSPIVEVDRGRVLIFEDSGSAYEQWLAAHWSEAVLDDLLQRETVWGPLADPDADGLTNLEEAYLDSDPTKPTPRGLDTTVILGDAGNLFRWREGKETNGVVGRVAFSSDLLTWQLHPIRTSQSRTVGEGSGYLVREITFDAISRMFARIEVRQQ